MTANVTRTHSPTSTLRRHVPKSGRKPRHKQNLAGWAFVAPIIFGAIAFQLTPVAISLYISFTSWSGLTSAKFIGTDNYVQMFTNDPLFYSSLLHTAIFTVAAVVVSIAVGLALAVLCNRKLRGMYVFRTIYFSPVVTNVIAISFVWYYLYSPNNGFINSVLKLVGIHGPPWLTDSSTALIAVTAVAIWQSIGYPMVILLAGLQAVPSSLLEAATVDGASPWRRFWSITFPLLTPSLFFLIILQFITSFQVFGIIYAMTSGGPDNATSLFIYQIYTTAFAQGRLGYAAAMGWILFIIVGLVTFIQWRFESVWVHYDS